MVIVTQIAGQTQQNQCFRQACRAGVHLQRASIKVSFFFSASCVRGSRDAKYPASAAAANPAKASAGSQGLPVQRPINRMSEQIPARISCAPKPTHTATPELRCPRRDPNSIFRGKLSEVQLAMENCPVTAKTTAVRVATSDGGDMHRGGECVVRGLPHVDVIVRVHRRLAADLSSEELDGPIR